MESTVFIGVDLSSGIKPYIYAALDHELHIFALGTGHLQEIMDFCSGQQAALVGINGPPKIEHGMIRLEEVRQKLLPSPLYKEWADHGKSEFDLFQHGVHVTRVPLKLKQVPIWMKHGFMLYEQLGSLGYKPFSKQESPLLIFETHSEAIYWSLIGHSPYTPGTFESRLQKQLILFDRQVSVPDPMSYLEEISRHRIMQGKLPVDLIFSSEELNAVAIAYTAWLAHKYPHQLIRIGDVEDDIILPPLEIH